MFDELEDLENNSRSEIQRADHLIYVTLKYTRTADVIKSIIKRLINAFDYAIMELLEKAKDKKLLKSIPTRETERALLLEVIFPKNKAVKDYVNFYFMLKKLDKSKHGVKNEYRKHLTLIIEEFINVDVPLLIEFYKKTRIFVSYVRSY